MSIALSHAERRGVGDTATVSFSAGSLAYEENQLLYRLGEPRTCLYYIEKGVVALYRQASGRQKELIEFAFAGDIVGYGLFENHTSWAQTVGAALIRPMPLTALDAILRSDQRAFNRYAETLERDFQCRRNELVRAERGLTNRLAALLVALSRQNRLEGRDPSLVGDELQCGAVALWLNSEVSELTEALMALEELGLIARSLPSGLRLCDVPALERLASQGAARARCDSTVEG
jgi:CRP/FNR family transcriptional regulator